MTSPLTGFTSLADCDTCQDIPQKSAASTAGPGRLPAEGVQLRDIMPGLRQCPGCGTYYAYSENESPAELTRGEKISFTLERCSLFRARGCLAGNQYRAPLSDELELLQQRYEGLIHEFIGLLARRELSWHLKKYLIECLTDHYLVTGDREHLKTVLLEHPDPVVRVETASDLIYVATEPSAVWSIRDFSSELQALAHDLLFKHGGEFASYLVTVLADGLNRQGKAACLGTWRYNPMSIAEVAYYGLNNARYRQLDLAAAVPALVTWLLNNRSQWQRDRASEDLPAYVGTDPGRARAVLEELDRREAQGELAEGLRRHCRALLADGGGQR